MKSKMKIIAALSFVLMGIIEIALGCAGIYYFFIGLKPLEGWGIFYLAIGIPSAFFLPSGIIFLCRIPRFFSIHEFFLSAMGLFFIFLNISVLVDHWREISLFALCGFSYCLLASIFSARIKRFYLEGMFSRKQVNILIVYLGIASFIFFWVMIFKEQF